MPDGPAECNCPGLLDRAAKEHAHASAYPCPSSQEAQETLSGLPALPARHETLGEENPRQTPLLWLLGGRLASRPGEVSRSTRRPARRPNATRPGGRPDDHGTGE